MTTLPRGPSDRELIVRLRLQQDRVRDAYASYRRECRELQLLCTLAKSSGPSEAGENSADR